MYPCALQYVQSRSLPEGAAPLSPPAPVPVPVPVGPELGPQLPTGGAVFALFPYVTSPPGLGKITSVPAAVEHPLPMFAWKSGVPAARGDKCMRLRINLRPPEIVTTAQFMYISRLPCWLNQVLIKRNTRFSKMYVSYVWEGGGIYIYTYHAKRTSPLWALLGILKPNSCEPLGSGLAQPPIIDLITTHVFPPS